MQKGYWSTWCSALLFFVAYYALLVPVPVYLNHIGLSDWEIGVILGAFGVAALISRPLAGMFSDCYGGRVVMLFGAGALILGVFGMSVTIQPTLLFICRLLQAIGYAAFTTAATALIAALATPEKRGSSLAFFGISVNTSMAIIPGMITSLMTYFTLQGIFWLAGVITVMTGIVVSISVPRTSRIKVLNVNWQAIYAIPQELWVPMALTILFGVGYGAFIQFLPLLAERREIGSAGVVFTVYGISIILTRLTTGKLLDQGPRHRLMLPAILILSTSLMGFAFGPSQMWIFISAGLMALSSGILHPALIAMHVDRLTETAAGRATGVFYIGFDLGIGMGAWILTPALHYVGLSGLYVLAALLSGAGIFLLPALSIPTSLAASAKSNS